MTLAEAIAEETRRYLWHCQLAAGHTHANGEQCHYVHMAHIHLRALQRLRHRQVTEHEAVCHQTPSVHAYADLDGYSLAVAS